MESTSNPDIAGEQVQSDTESTEEEPPAPWHLKLMLLGLIFYLAYRGFQLVEWLIHRAG